MIKKISFIILLLVSLNMEAQTYKNGDYINLYSKIDTLLISYIKFSQFKKEFDNKIDTKTVQEFKNLFIPSAKIADEICPAFYDGEYERPYELPRRSLEDYSIRISDIFPGGLDVKITNAAISFKEIKSKKVYLVLEKTVKGKTFSGLRIENHDTIEMEIQISDDKMNLKIANTRMIGYTLNFQNDIDMDFIQDDMDKCPKKKWLGGNGCPPPPSTPRVKERLQVSLNLLTGNVKNQYDFKDNFNMVYPKSEMISDNINTKPLITELKTKGFELMAGYFLKPYSRLGIKTGIQYQVMNGLIEKNGFNATYKARDKWDNIFIQRIKTTADNTLKEKFTVKQMSIPLLLVYKRNIKGKFGFQLEGGINLLLQCSGKSTPDANNKFDYEAIYYSNNIADPEHPDYQFNSAYEDGKNGYWPITRISSLQNKTNFDDLYSQGYNVGLNSKIDNSNSNFNFTGKIGIIIRPTINYNLSDVSGISLGLLYMSNLYQNQSDVSTYSMTKNVGKYNTMLNSIDNLKTSTTAFSLGFYYAFSLKKSQ